MLNLLIDKLGLSDKGASMVEYALLVLLIAIMGFVAVDFFGGSVSSTYSEIGSAMTAAGS